jgi:hypothetical protein
MSTTTGRTPGGDELVVLVNHFKSKGFGVQSENDKRRRRQAVRTAAIYDRLIAAGHTKIAILGDFNDTPDDPLGNGTKSQKIDYILLSPDLYATVVGGMIFRLGVWGGTKGTLFPHYPTMTSKVHQASDHAAIYADLNL